MLDQFGSCAQEQSGDHHNLYGMISEPGQMATFSDPPDLQITVYSENQQVNDLVRLKQISKFRQLWKNFSRNYRQQDDDNTPGDTLEIVFQKFNQWLRGRRDQAPIRAA
jgi:hypothetical protein